MPVSIRKVRVAVIVFNAEGQILLCRQNNKPFWVLPGGTLEPDESILDCGARELLEEVNLNVKIEHIIGISDFLRPEHPQAIDITCYGTLTSGEFRTSNEENINDTRFFSRSEVEALDIKPDYIKPLLLKHWKNHDFPICSYLQ